MARPLRSAIASCIALCVTLAACSSGKPHAKRSSDASSSTSASPPSTSVSLSPLPITPLPSSPTPSTPAQRAATDALLSATQLPGFQEILWTITPVPQPCLAADTTPVFTQAPPKTLVGRQFSLASPQGVLTEQIAVYAKAADAVAAGNLTTAGLACAQGKFSQPDGSAQSVTVAGPADLRGVVGADVQSASSWTMQNETLTSTLLIIVDAQVMVMLSFISPSNADLSKLPSGEAIAQLAISDVRTSTLVQPSAASSSSRKSGKSSAPRSSASSRH